MGVSAGTVKKLSIRDAPPLEKVSVQDLRPYELLKAPLYLLLRRHGHYVAWKRTLDWLMPEDIERIWQANVVYFPENPNPPDPWLALGRRLRKLLVWKDEHTEHPLDPFERSDAALRLLAPALTDRVELHPEVATWVVEGLCGNLGARPRAPDSERRLLISTAATWGALMLGHNRLAYLEALRKTVYLEGASGNPELDSWVTQAAIAAYDSQDQPWVLRSWAGEMPAGWKLKHRMERVVGLNRG